MNVRHALSRQNSVPLNARSRSRSTRPRSARRDASNASRRKAWLQSGGGTPDYDLREVVAQRFMSMSEAHDRIRTKLLRTGR
jgi:hypothetical protein